MTNAWTNSELEKLAGVDELEISSRRRDGTLRDPATMWMVRHGEDLYVRSVKGRDGAWFRGAVARHEGRIQAAGVRKDVTFVEDESAPTDDIDRAYRSRYRRYAANIVNSVLTPQARAATLRVVPRADMRAAGSAPDGSRTRPRR